MMSRSQCTGSSPVKPTNSRKKKLKEQLRKLDKKLKWLHWYTIDSFWKETYPQEYERLLRLDKKRKEVRNELKGYKVVAD